MNASSFHFTALVSKDTHSCIFASFDNLRLCCLQVVETILVSLQDTGCKATQLKVKITILESDTENSQWFFLSSKFL